MQKFLFLLDAGDPFLQLCRIVSRNMGRNGLNNNRFLTNRAARLNVSGYEVLIQKNNVQYFQCANVSEVLQMVSK